MVRVFPVPKLARIYAQQRYSGSACMTAPILVCGHYEGVDERFLEECVDEEISMGDFVLTGGEIPALAASARGPRCRGAR